MSKLLRFRIGRWLIHAGLKCFPKGRVRHELTVLIEEWTRRVRVEIAR